VKFIVLYAKAQKNIHKTPIRLVTIATVKVLSNATFAWVKVKLMIVSQMTFGVKKRNIQKRQLLIDSQ